MARYIKSYSNYVLKKKHQEINDGFIYERDITTIGGRDQFAKGQIPIYKSGNFVITTNSDDTSYKKTSSVAWEKNDTGDDVWTLDILSNYEKDEKSSYDEKIVIKKDYHDLRDFAYYGSCSELIRSSINHILKTYPGELYIPVKVVWISNDEKTFYSEEAAKAYAGEGNYREAYAPLDAKYTDTKVYPSVQRTFELPSDVDNGKLAQLFAVSNPFNINVHSKVLPEGADPLKYFAEEGYKNYVGYHYVDGEWDFDNPLIIKPEEFEPYTTDPLVKYCPGDYIGKLKVCFYNKITRMFVDTEDISVCENCDGKVETNFKVEFNETDEDSSSIEKIYEECEGLNQMVGFGMFSPELVGCITIYVFIGDNGETKYFVDLADININEGECVDDLMEISVTSGITDDWKYRIRPNEKVINDYYNNLETFERILLDNGNSFTSYFEAIKENDYGYYTNIEKFVFPTTYGGYNLGGSGIAFSNFLDGLIEIGEFYDERFSDNLWRSMTHEAIRNFDWTYTRHYTPGDEQPFIEGGSKIQKIIRIYGREFDEIKSYIDGISNVNTITYDNANNLPDYFFTDKLEDDGWDVKLINPLKLTEYVDGKEVDIPEESKRESELKNEYDCKKLERVFNYDFDIQHIKPYSKDRIESIKQSKCDIVDSTLDFHIGFEDDIIDECVNCNSGGTYDLISEIGESQKDGYHDDCCNFIKIYSSEREYKMSDVNSEFLKRFILNSKEILRHKGTIEGIEMLLGLFGLRSKNYALSNETYFKQRKDGLNLNIVGDGDICSNKDSIDFKDINIEGQTSYDSHNLTIDGKRYYKKNNINTKAIYDYDIKEYTLFTTRIEDYFDTNKNMYHYDWINSIKLNVNSNYKSYQGLPVAYRNTENNVRYLYPSFQKNVAYDGNPYYQMNGGWLSKKPFMFDIDNNIIPTNFYKNNRKSNTLFTETLKNIKCVQTLSELLANKSLAINPGDICQVVDLSGKFAVVDGLVYDLYDETDNISYFYATIENNSLSVGSAFFIDYVYVSNPYSPDGLKRYDLNDVSNNGRDIKIYVTKKTDGTYDVDVHSNSSSITTFTVFENGKYMEGDNFTHYFRVNNPDFYNELSVIGWQQLRDNEYEYFVMNSITDNNKGNNPHTGHMNYDNGHEYLTYFSKLFKHSYDNSLFDEREMDESDFVYDDVSDYGFKNLIDGDDICNKDYDAFLQEDTKCHYFGDFITSSGKRITYDLENDRRKENVYSVPDVIRKPVLSFEGVDEQHYGAGVTGIIDGVTNQIVNTKRIEIDFYINSSVMYSNEWLEEVKYIDSVILPYLSQMLPSTIICTINYKQSNICK